MRAHWRTTLQHLPIAIRYKIRKNIKGCKTREKKTEKSLLKYYECSSLYVTKGFSLT